MSELDPQARRDTADEMERRAAEFLQRRRFWDWDDRDQAKLDAWLEESVLHRVAYLRLEDGAARMEKMAVLRPSKREGDAGQGANRSRRIVFPLLIAATLLVALGLGIPFALHLMQPPDRSFATEVGGRGQLKFADGTEIELNTDSAVRYRMTTAERTVWLDRGEGFFRVAHDASHPFVLYVGNHRVVDLGTEFLVRRNPGSDEVTLLKGRAQIGSEGANARVALLAPGDEALATPTSIAIVKKSRQELLDELAWQRGMLVFRNTRLADAVREFNRYNQIKLVIADPAIAGMKIGGEFRTNNIDDFLGLAQTVLRLRVQRERNDILLSRNAGEVTGAAGSKRSP